MAEKIIKDNRGYLYPNSNKTKPTHPDYTGGLLADGKEWRLAAWENQSTDGKKYLSMIISPPLTAEQQNQYKRADEPQSSNSNVPVNTHNSNNNSNNGNSNSNNNNNGNNGNSGNQNTNNPNNNHNNNSNNSNQNSNNYHNSNNGNNNNGNNNSGNNNHNEQNKMQDEYYNKLNNPSNDLDDLDEILRSDDDNPFN